MKKIASLFVATLAAVSVAAQAAPKNAMLKCGEDTNKELTEKVLFSYTYSKDKKIGGVSGFGSTVFCTRPGYLDTEAGLREEIAVLEKESGISGITPMMIKVLTK
ncbi:MAG TPA: hypothetical protein VK832_12960 [Burkholderiaceae bacterium]|jgi:hypothetical protein|nr:hypothetical protein [Burkholderiaceae bacterium]